jgi:glycosyltransferase involved in cell wall biosynthesis
MRHIRVALWADRVGTRVPGGIGRYALELSVALSRLLDSAPEMRSPRASAIGRFTLVSQQFLRFPPIRANTDVVHATSLAIPPTSQPLVVTVHDLIFEKWPQAFTRWGIAFHQRGLEIASERARLVITPTQAVADELQERHPKFSGRVLAVHHGIPSFCSNDWNRRAASHEAIPVFLPEMPFFLWVGTIEPRKNLRRLIQAFSLLAKSNPDIALVLTGRLGWKMRREALLRGPGMSSLENRVFFVDDPNDSALRLLYEKSVALVLPSIDEGFGFPVIEAMALGVPVIASDIPPIREVAGSAGIFVDPKRVGDLADAMASILDEPALAARLAKAGAERAHSFSWDASARSHIDVYRRALET